MKFLIIFTIIVVKCFAQDFRGRAYKENSLFYIEEHFKLTKYKRRIDYRDPDGKIIAQMWINNQDSMIMPETFFWDRRASLFYGNYIHNNVLHLFNELPSQQTNSFELVWDHQYLIRQSLSDFLINNKQGPRYNLNFIFYPSLEIKPMRMIKMNLGKYVEIKLMPLKLIDKLFQPRLYLKFDATSGKMIEYKGPSEIADDEGLYARVEIYFDYPEK